MNASNLIINILIISPSTIGTRIRELINIRLYICDHVNRREQKY
jgi:hypothetical protein